MPKRDAQVEVTCPGCGEKRMTRHSYARSNTSRLCYPKCIVNQAKHGGWNSWQKGKT